MKQFVVNGQIMLVIHLSAHAHRVGAGGEGGRACRLPNL